MPIGEHFLQRRAEFHDTDRVGMVHFSNYFRYMDTAVCEFFRALGLPGPLTRYWGGTKDDELDWPYVSTSCDFKRPLQFDDVVEIHIWIKKIGTKSLTFGITFKVAGTELAQGQVVVVCSTGIQGQPQTVEIPQFIRERLAVPAWVQPSA
ncbi:MAG: acyl-CoA thioesterase [Acidobacteria bacterium]|nr:acyl-CoA thioesterase [Acidobacteriota bacterium]